MVSKFRPWRHVLRSFCYELWCRRHELTLWAISIMLPGLFWLIRRTHFMRPGPLRRLLSFYLIDVVAVPFTVMALLLLGGVFIRPWYQRWRGDRPMRLRGLVGVATVSLGFWWWTELRQRSGPVLRWQAVPGTHRFRALWWLNDLLGRVFDWRDLVAEALGFGITVYCLLRCRRIYAQHELRPLWWPAPKRRPEPVPEPVLSPES